MGSEALEVGVSGDTEAESQALSLREWAEPSWEALRGFGVLDSLFSRLGSA